VVAVSLKKKKTNKKTKNTTGYFGHRGWALGWGLGVSIGEIGRAHV